MSRMKSISRRIQRRVRRALVDANLLPLIQPRRFDACCCGLSKTGTHSMSAIFMNYRTAHHPDADLRLDLAIRFLTGQARARDIEPILSHRDRHLWLEMESSTLSGILIESLVGACPTKRYIFTIRDVYSWMDSYIDHNINHPPKASRFSELDRIRLRMDDFPHTAHDTPLADRGLASLASYFTLWNDHNQRVVAALPEDRMLVVRTNELLERLPDIARFVGVAPHTLRADLGRQFVAPKRNRVLSTLDPAYVEDTAMRHCGDLMARFFPGLKLTSPGEFPGRGDHRAAGFR